jgi:hypothetical protein
MTSFEQIHGNLVRQKKGLELLQDLLEEEFSLLRETKTEEVVALEFSIHELLRQLADERMAMKSVMQGTRAVEYADLLEPEQGAALKELLRGIDAAEQRAARQASHNTQLSLALLDQSQELLDYLHGEVTPKSVSVYGAKGGYKAQRPEAALFNGRA